MPMTDAEADALMVRLTRKSAEGCCMNPEWRGHQCQYHQGFEDGCEMFWRALRAEEQG